MTAEAIERPTESERNTLKTTSSPYVSDFTEAEFELLSQVWHFHVPSRDMTREQKDAWNHYRRNIGAASRQVDDAIVEQAVRGLRPLMNRREKWAAIDILTRQGKSTAQIARMLGCVERTVTRRRSRTAAALHVVR